MKKRICLLISLVMLLSLFTGCGNSTGETVVTVGEEKVTQGEIEFLIANFVESTKAQFSSNAMTEEQQKEYWQTDIEGKKPADYIKEMAVSDMIYYAAFSQAAKDSDITVVSSEVNSKLSQVIDNDTISLYKNTYGISKASIKEVLRKQMLTDKYVQRVLSREAGFQPSKEELVEILKRDYIKAQHILISTVDEATGAPLSEEETLKKQELAQSLLKRARNGEDFESLVMNYGEDPGAVQSPEGYVFTEGEMVTEFYEGAKALEAGGISDLVKTSYGYHIIKRLPLEEDDLVAKETTIINYYQNDYMTKKSEELKSKYQVSQEDELISKITVKTGF